MKITFFIGSLYGGGSERVTCSIASYLAQKEHGVEILTMSETDKAYELDERVSVRSLLPAEKKGGTLHNNIVRITGLIKYLRKTKNDVYVVMLPVTIILLLAFKWLSHAKFVVSERANPASYTGLIAKLLRHYSRRADGFVFQTDDAKQWYDSIIKNKKYEVIPNAINPVFIREPYTGEKRKIIAAAGRLRQVKNFEMLIKAFDLVRDEFPDYSVCIYGEGERRPQLEALVKELGLEGRVTLPGNAQNIADEMERNSLFVLSSDFEGMPNALMEAMALGLPCISTDCPCGGPRFLIENGVNGVLVPVRDDMAMAQALRTLLGDEELMKTIGKKAADISKVLSPEIIFGKWEAFLENVIYG